MADTWKDNTVRRSRKKHNVGLSLPSRAGERGETECHHILVQGLCLCFSYCGAEQPVTALSHKASFVCALKWNLQCLSGLEGAAWELQRTSNADLDREYRPHLLPLSSALPRVFCCSPDFEGPQMLADWHILLFILVILLHLRVSTGWH